MPRNARLVAVGYPHHVTQRGNNREPVFFDDQDRQTYIDLLKQYTQKFKVDLWAYCLMPNHIHLLGVPWEQDSLALGVGRTNQVYTRYINRKYFRSGRVWQNRFYSCIVDHDEYLWEVARYIENNPVKAGLVSTAVEYEWSSARYHLESRGDILMVRSNWLSEEDQPEYGKFVSQDERRMTEMITQATRSGRPFCKPSTLSELERLLETGRTA